MISYDALRAILTMSVTGSVIAIILFVLKPLLRNRLPKSAQYYLWFVVLAALVVPISKFIVLPDSTSDVPTISKTVDWYIVSNEDIFERIRPYETENAEGFIGIPESSMAEVEALVPDSWVPEAVDWFRLAHYLGVIIYLPFIYCSYNAFTSKIKRRNTTATTEENAILAELCGNRRVPLLYRNPLASTPMLIGLFRPTIILPDREYTNEQLHAVLLHELTHLRRKDVLVKWLSVLVAAIHWFNPIVWLVRREIDRACELSCDEAVIRNLDTDGKQNYGETLLYVAADAKTLHAVLSTTMCEEKKALKERLGAIMKSKKHTRLAIIVSVVLIIAVGGAVIALGAGKAIPLNEPPGIMIKAGDIEIAWEVGLNKWNGSIYDRLDNFQSIMSKTTSDELPYIRNNETITINFNGKNPQTTQLTEYVFDENGSPALKVGGMSYIPSLTGKGVFTLTPYSDARLISGRDEYEPGISTKGYRFVCSWGGNECEYTFIIRTDSPILMEPIAENATRPVVTLYGVDQSKDNGDPDQVKKHFTSRLQPDVNTGVTVLTDMIFIDVRVPEGAVSMRTYYAEVGGMGYRMADNKWSHPHQYSPEELLHPSGNTFSARDINPDGFTGSIWAITTDIGGVEHTSDAIPVIWFNSLPESQEATPLGNSFDTSELQKASPKTMGHEIVNDEVIKLLSDMYDNSEYVHMQKGFFEGETSTITYPFINVDDEIFGQLLSLFAEYEWRANRTLSSYSASDFDLFIEIYTPDMDSILTVYGGYDLIQYRDKVNDITAFYTYIPPENGVYVDLAERLKGIADK